MPQYIITLEEDSTRSNAPEKYEQQVALKAAKDHGGSIAEGNDFDWGFIVDFPDDSVSVSAIMENKTFKTIEDGQGQVTTQEG
ncbi:70b02d95-a4f0-4a70-bd31-61fdac92af98 [Sclerotinia trifoliorum]|uniref:70b02d95-a4f0-4a70-bd31-61fdac92af98 n=1 Tax=Sclerotinia trifoliorum TaxID=28548 RepID=A0A8H2W2C7_9HELO|nr:70b02d95-a4f0-4a70-bd31-61fdac92af98 [Sclerotinia trifoliorum]